MGVSHLVIGFVLVTASQCYLENLAANIVIQGNSKQEPMVAFICNKTAMHLTDDGWVADHTTDCLKSEKEIIRYCEKMYPKHKTSRVAQANKEHIVDNWCRLGKKHCKKHNKHSVRPYKCLAGEWKSRALLVPDHCVFHHLHNKKDSKCNKMSLWVEKSHAWCANQGYTVKSRAMLRPCSHVTYTGIEFVCCPPAKKHKVVAKKGPKMGKSDKMHSLMAPAVAPHKPDSYDLYMHENGKERYLREHQMFLEAKRKLQNHQHDKMARLMEDWSKARRNVEDLKITNPKKSKTLNTEITKNYEKTYLAMETEGRNEKRQLVAVHEQHVMANLNARKRKTLDKYIQRLQQKDPKPTEILKALERYIRVEEKDRRHTINHYQHLMDTDTAEADRKRQHIIAHLKNCDARIHDGITMLDRVPKFAKKLKEHARNFVKTFRDTDLKIIRMLIHPKPQVVHVGKTKVKAEVKSKVKTEVKPKVASDVVEDYRKEYSKEHKTIPHIGKEHQKIEKHRGYKKHIDWKKPSKMDPETYEDEHKYMKQNYPAHVKTNRESVNQNSIDLNEVEKSHITANSITSTVVGIVVGCLAVVGVIIIAIVVVKKKSARRPVNHGFIEVDQCTPEEKHVANMQVNGYENPTYRYFEEVVA